VNVYEKGLTYLKDVEQGDKVQVSSNKYQELYGFGHRDVYSVATFLQIKTSADQIPLEITAEHLLMKHNKLTGEVDPVRADSIKVGDFLIGSKGAGEEVIEISSVRRPGLYSPLTEDGKLMVGGVQVSSYIAVQDKDPEHFMVGDKEMISHHLISHAAIAPFRALCLVRHFSYLCEERNAEGLLLFASEGDNAIGWIMEQADDVQMIVMPLVLVFITIVHFTMVHWLPLACLLASHLVCSYFVWKRSYKKIQVL
jgi:hypothetical protein